MPLPAVAEPRHLSMGPIESSEGPKPSVQTDPGEVKGRPPSRSRRRILRHFQHKTHQHPKVSQENTTPPTPTNPSHPHTRDSP
jgi:hypothetical protein